MSDQWDQVSIIIHTKLTGGDSRVVLSGWKCLQLQKLKLAWNTFRFAQSADVDLRVGRFSIKIISKPESQTSHSPQLPENHLLLSFQKVRESIFPIFCPRWGCGEVVIHMLLRQSSWVMTILALIGNYLRISLALITTSRSTSGQLSSISDMSPASPQSVPTVPAIYSNSDIASSVSKVKFLHKSWISGGWRLLHRSGYFSK